ncbi:MAG: FtsW/RodA/SpoVE family cell cycle protein [Rhodospirillales bacterium]
MNNAFARTDTSRLATWWWSVDRWTLAALLLLLLAGVLLTLAASPAVAERIGVSEFHFVRRQLAFLPLAAAALIWVSFMDERAVRVLAGVMLAGALALTAMTLITGDEIKGATRWLRVGPFSVQPSEFMKPAFAVTAAWMFAEARRSGSFPGRLAAAALFALTAALLLLQPDVGMALVIAAIWAVEFFLAGMAVWAAVLIAALFIAAVGAAYFVFPHVQARVDGFFAGDGATGYQVGRALEAFRAGGLFGRGPGEGRVKDTLPDAHADFIFAVAGEEYGLIVCLFIVAVFAAIVLRGFTRAFESESLFRLIAVAGLMTQFGLQAVINIASTMNLIPPKGMTLPFISYGGSSTLALALAMGMALALTKRKPGAVP